MACPPNSPDLLNAVRVEELFYLEKREGYTTIKRASNDPQIVEYMSAGDKLGRIWEDGLFVGVDPQ